MTTKARRLYHKLFRPECYAQVLGAGDSTPYPCHFGHFHCPWGKACLKQYGRRLRRGDFCEQLFALAFGAHNCKDTMNIPCVVYDICKRRISGKHFSAKNQRQ